MVNNKNQALQDVFLNQIRKDRVLATIFLRNGVRLQGYIVAFDNFSILLKRDNQQQLIYKHAISTVMPASLLTLTNEDKEDIG